MVLCPQKLKEKKQNGFENGTTRQSIGKGKDKKMSPKHQKPHPIPNSNSNHMLTSPGGSYHASASQPGTPMSPMTGQISGNSWLRRQEFSQKKLVLQISKKNFQKQTAMHNKSKQVPCTQTWQTYSKQCCCSSVCSCRRCVNRIRSSKMQRQQMPAQLPSTRAKNS